MEKEFVPYKLAVKLKEMGFDEECFYVRVKECPEFLYTPTDYEDYPEQKDEEVLIPLWQQAFDWFTRKGLHSYIEGAYPWFRYYINTADNRYEGFKHLKIEEARQACLEKLIQIIEDENKKNSIMLYLIIKQAGIWQLE